MKIVNLTPHELVIYSEEKEIKRIPSSGIVRVKEENEKIGEINSIPIFKKRYTRSEGLPEPEEDTFYFVSLIVAQANPQRDDLLLSSDLVRDENGRILGCKSFAQINPSKKFSNGSIPFKTIK